MPPVAAKKAVKSTPAASIAQPGSATAGASVMLQKMTDSLRKMGDKRPGKQASLRRALKPMLSGAASDASIEVALRNLMARSVVAIEASGAVSYSQFQRGPRRFRPEPERPWWE